MGGSPTIGFSAGGDPSGVTVRLFADRPAITVFCRLILREAFKHVNSCTKEHIELTIKALRSTPLQPLAARMRELATTCERFDLATAFVSERAVTDLIKSALAAGAILRFLTGTFGAATRKKTFNTLWRLSQSNPLTARIWTCATHRSFHAKLYLWRFRNGRAVAWVGSSNFTEGGLQSEGELIVEFNGKWEDQALRRLRDAFEHEWKRSDPLSKEFIETYEESARLPPDFAVPRKSALRARSRNDRAAHEARFFVTTVRRHFSAGTSTYDRIEKLLGGTAEMWLQHYSKTLSSVQVGQRGLLVDTVDQDAAVIEITDRARDGNATVFAYEAVFPRKGWVRWNAATRKVLAAAGLPSTAKGPRAALVEASVGESITKAFYQGRVKKKLAQ